MTMSNQGRRNYATLSTWLIPCALLMIITSNCSADTDTKMFVDFPVHRVPKELFHSDDNHPIRAGNAMYDSLLRLVNDEKSNWKYVDPRATIAIIRPDSFFDSEAMFIVCKANVMSVSYVAVPDDPDYRSLPAEATFTIVQDNRTNLNEQYDAVLKDRALRLNQSLLEQRRVGTWAAMPYVAYPSGSKLVSLAKAVPCLQLIEGGAKQ